MCIRYVKCRQTKRHEPFYAAWDADIHALVECERPANAANKEDLKRGLVRDVFKGVRMTRKGFARDYALLKGLASDSKTGFNLFAEALKSEWITEDSEKSTDGETLYWFANDKPETKDDDENSLYEISF